MIEHGGECVRATAIALVVTDNVHARRQRLLRNPERILRFARTLEPVHDDDGQGVGSVRLPVTMAQHLNTRRDLDEPLLRHGQIEPARQQKAGDGLHMPTSQPTARHEGFGLNG